MTDRQNMEGAGLCELAADVATVLQARTEELAALVQRSKGAGV